MKGNKTRGMREKVRLEKARKEKGKKVRREKIMKESKRMVWEESKFHTFSYIFFFISFNLFLTWSFLLTNLYC